MHTPNLSNVIKGIEEKMPWSQVIQLLKRYIRLESKGYHLLPCFPYKTVVGIFKKRVSRC